MTPTLLHALFEAAAYAIGFRLFLRERRRRALPALADREASLAIGVGAIPRRRARREDRPLAVRPGLRVRRAPGRPPPRLEAPAGGGKSIIGALLGGLAGWGSRRSSTACAVRPGMPSSGH